MGKLKFELGIRSMDAQTYHADPVPGGSLSQSGAKLLLPPSCPAIFHYRQTHPQRPTKAFSFGHAAHAEVLGVGRPMVAIPDELLSATGSTNTKAAREFIEQAEADGRTPLKADIVDTIYAMAAALRAHPVASKLFRNGTPEQAMFWADDYQPIIRRGMLDWLPDPGRGRLIVPDYKTAESASPEKFQQAMATYGYHRQARWYLDGLESLGISSDAAFVFVVQDKNPPYVVSVIEPDPTALKIADIQNRQAIDIYADCVKYNTWPGYSDGVSLVRMPRWVENEYEEEIFA